MKKQQIKLGLIAASFTVMNRLLINFLIIDINFLKYLIIEGIWAVSYLVYQKESKRLKG